MVSFSHFSYVLSLFLAQLSSKLGQEPEISYVHLVGALDKDFEGLGFSTPLHSLIASKKWGFGFFLLFFDFVPRIISLQIEDVLFVDLDFSALSHSLTPLKSDFLAIFSHFLSSFLA